jgi:hypothetical protein
MTASYGFINATSHYLKQLLRRIDEKIGPGGEEPLPAVPAPGDGHRPDARGPRLFDVAHRVADVERYSGPFRIRPIHEGRSGLVMRLAKVILDSRQECAALLDFQGGDGLDDFLIDVVIGDLPDLAGVQEHPMKFGIDLPRLGEMVPKGGLDHRMLYDIDPVGIQQRLGGVKHGVIYCARRIRDVSALQQVFGHFEGMFGFTDISSGLYLLASSVIWECLLFRRVCKMTFPLPWNCENALRRRLSTR